MKRVSFSVAKALKEAGYPQDLTISHYTYYGDLVPYGIAGETGFDVPTYLEAWLWLWQEKKIGITILHCHPKGVCPHIVICDKYCNTEIIVCDGPEEAIIAAIEFLIENNLIK